MSRDIARPLAAMVYRRAKAGLRGGINFNQHHRMTTYQNALVTVAAWCKANPGRHFRLKYWQLSLMGENEQTLAQWAERNGLLVEYPAPESITASRMIHVLQPPAE
jgi:hypothetical protein